MSNTKNASLSDLALSLSQDLAMAKAIADSFAGDYIDIPDDFLSRAAVLDPASYRNLYGALCRLLNLAINKADEIEKASF